MGYYNYHAEVTKRIRAGKLKSYHFENNYKDIGFCLLLCFEDKNFPVREKHFLNYFDLIGKFYFTKKNKNKFITILKDNIV